MKPLAIMALAAAIVTLAMTAAIAHAPATDDTPRPKPRPPMDCWADETGMLAGCRVKQ